MQDALEAVIDEWHVGVNSRDPDRAAASVSDPVVVLGPKGAGAISRAQFGEWVVRSGITLQPLLWRHISDRLVVVMQEVTWPGNAPPSQVASVFRVVDGQVTAVLRLPDFAAAVELATICRELAATE